jgi:hypothetical protein
MIELPTRRRNWMSSFNKNSGVFTPFYLISFQDGFQEFAGRSDTDSSFELDKKQ